MQKIVECYSFCLRIVTLYRRSHGELRFYFYGDIWGLKTYSIDFTSAINSSQHNKNRLKQVHASKMNTTREVCDESSLVRVHQSIESLLEKNSWRNTKDVFHVVLISFLWNSYNQQLFMLALAHVLSDLRTLKQWQSNEFKYTFVEPLDL